MRALALLAGLLVVGTGVADPGVPDPTKALRDLREALASGSPEGLHLQRLVPAPAGVAAVEVSAEEAAVVLGLWHGEPRGLGPASPVNFLGAGVRGGGTPGWPACYGTTLSAILIPGPNPANYVQAEPAPLSLSTEPVCPGSGPAATWASVAIDLRKPGIWFATTCAAAQATLIDAALGTQCSANGWDLGCARGDGSLYLFWGFGASFITWLGATSAVAAMAPGAPDDVKDASCS